MRFQWKDTAFLFIDEISVVPYEMLYMIDSRLKQLKNCDDGGINVILFGDLMQLTPVRGSQVFHQPQHFAPAHTFMAFVFSSRTHREYATTRQIRLVVTF